MKTTVIFSHSGTGHILEYFSHLYNYCCAVENRKFVFVVPDSFKEVKGKVVWPICDYFTFDYIPQYKIDVYLKSGYWTFLWKITKLLRKKVIQYHADRVLSLFWFPLTPFGSLLIPSYTKVSAIFYDVYLRDYLSMSNKARVKNHFLFSLLARSSRVYKCYILNDESITNTLNKKYKTNKFTYLPDPYVPIKSDLTFDFRVKYNIPQTSTVFLHFGGLAKRKGTINILQAIKALPPEDKANYYFVFAGVVDKKIHDEFYSLVNELQHSSHIIVNDAFCSYEYLAVLCSSCDAILIPYLYTNRSSGILGYASQFGKPLLAPNNGLLGDLINEFHLGLTDKVDTPEGIVNIIKRFTSEQIESPDFNYCNKNSVERFCDVIKKSLIDEYESDCKTK